MPGKCSKDGLLAQLKQLVQQIDDGNQNNDSNNCCPQPVCCETPFAQVCFTCPPCLPLPTVPCPVKPLQLPCPQSAAGHQNAITAEREAYNSRYDNFYNYYNVDYHQEALVRTNTGGADQCNSSRMNGVTVDGKSPQCDDYLENKERSAARASCNDGCPTGFKPCSMKLAPPQCCNPIAPWCAQIMPCPPKSKKAEVSNTLPPPDQCDRPGCKHWKPEGGPCLYDEPCKAHCFNHPPGIKPSGRY